MSSFNVGDLKVGRYLVRHSEYSEEKEVEIKDGPYGLEVWTQRQDWPVHSGSSGIKRFLGKYEIIRQLDAPE
jgi:hypothetical protein